MPNADVLTADEAAAELRIGRLQLLRLVTRHDIPVLRINRREVRFDAIAMAAVKEAIRQCRSASTDGQTPGRSTSRAQSGPPVRTRDTEYDNALDLITKRQLARKRQRSNYRSFATTTSAPSQRNVVSLRR